MTPMSRSSCGAGTWRRNSHAVYAEQAALVVVFVSAGVRRRDWTRLERRAALARAVRERREYVLPARFDDTRAARPAGLTWWRWTCAGRTPQRFADLVAAKLATLAVASPGGPAGPGRSPRWPGGC